MEIKQEFKQGGSAYSKLKIGDHQIKPMGELPAPIEGMSNDEYVEEKIKEIKRFYSHLNQKRIQVQGKDAFDVDKETPGYLDNIRSYVKNIANELDNLKEVMSIYSYNDERLDGEEDMGDEEANPFGAYEAMNDLF